MSQPFERELAAPPLGARSACGIEVPIRVGPEAVERDRIGEPGRYPFTRGIFPDGYRGRLWTIRQYSGFGTAEESNQRYRFLLEQGQTGLSVALDLPTQCGLDPTDPMAAPEIGKVGVSLSNLSEAEILFANIDLSGISTSFTINGSAAIVYAMYLAVADRQGVPREKLTGTLQNDILKEYVARGTWIFPVRPSMRLIADTILFSNRETPRFNPISIAGAHVRDAGATAAEEVGYTLANALAYVEELRRRGGDVEKFARRLSFFTDRMEEEIEAVMRAIDDYGGVIPAIEDGWLQMRLAERALERKARIDRGETVIVGQNHFRRPDQRNDVGEVFRLDPDVARRVLEKHRAVLETRSHPAVEASLRRLGEAAGRDDENLMPYLVDCCHAYATVGEMVTCLKREWGEFREPVRL